MNNEEIKFKKATFYVYLATRIKYELGMKFDREKLLLKIERLECIEQAPNFYDFVGDCLISRFK